MATSKNCLYKGFEIDVAQALHIRKAGRGPVFLCLECKSPVKVHKAGGRTVGHFEHLQRNDSCRLSHSKAYKYAPEKRTSQHRQRPISEAGAEEGLREERQHFLKKRNAPLARECKRFNDYTCQACGFKCKSGNRYIIDCHHLKPLEFGVRETRFTDLVCLCPNCHRIAHSEDPPIALRQLKVIAGVCSCKLLRNKY
ncbi:MAG: HNH endonuclease [Verrucomicrobiales bacterium]|nr:HNH endonuclease [Verrucomicrobiales bacterium]